MGGGGVGGGVGTANNSTNSWTWQSIENSFTWFTQCTYSICIAGKQIVKALKR